MLSHLTNGSFELILHKLYTERLSKLILFYYNHGKEGNKERAEAKVKKEQEIKKISTEPNKQNQKEKKNPAEETWPTSNPIFFLFCLVSEDRKMTRKTVMECSPSTHNKVQRGSSHTDGFQTRSA